MLHARTPTDDAGLSDTRFFLTYVDWHRPLGDLLTAMRSARQFCDLARRCAQASGEARDLANWRFFAREVQAVAKALRELHGQEIILPPEFDVPTID